MGQNDKLKKTIFSIGSHVKGTSCRNSWRAKMHLCCQKVLHKASVSCVYIVNETLSQREGRQNAIMNVEEDHKHTFLKDELGIFCLSL